MELTKMGIKQRFYFSVALSFGKVFILSNEFSQGFLIPTTGHASWIAPSSLRVPFVD
jgi:hypothetical protein